MVSPLGRNGGLVLQGPGSLGNLSFDERRDSQLQFMVLQELPAELLAKIFLNLDLRSALSFKRVNRLLHHLYKDSAQLQYHVECGIAGVYNNPRCSLPIQTRLQMLRDRELAWASLRPARSENLSFPPSEMNAFDLTGGYFHAVLTEPSTGTLPRISSYPIPTHQKEETRSKCQLELSVEGLLKVATCIDENDLVVCLVKRGPPDGPFEFHILLFQHSSGGPHPSAAKTTFSVFQSSDRRVRIFSQMQVVDENLVLAVESPFERLYFYNWKSGERKGTLPNHSGSDSFTFLRYDLLCNPHIEDRSLEIYYIPSSGEVGSVRCIQVLPLPLLQRGSHWIEVKSSPNPTFGGLFPKYVSTDQPFLECPEDAIIFIRFLKGISMTSMIVHRKTLLKLLPPREHWSNKTHTTDWDEWRSHVAVFETSGNFRFMVPGQNGQRCITVRPSEEPKVALGILDFNPYRVRKAQTTGVHAPVPHKAGLLPYLAVGLPEEIQVMEDTLFASHTGLLRLNFDGGKTGFGLHNAMYGILGDIQYSCLWACDSILEYERGIRDLTQGIDAVNLE